MPFQVPFHFVWLRESIADPIVNSSQRNPEDDRKQADVDSIDFREECYRCFRAASVCICDQVPTIANRTKVVVLQHHRELLHPIGTARIARLGFQQQEVRVARRHQKLAVPPYRKPKTALLYPHSQAKNLDQLAPEEYPQHLIVLDGTWAQASSMYRANSWLHAMPHLSIRPSQESNYRIRRQPKEGCLSTIEALVQALRILEPETQDLDDLLRVFDEMVDCQLKFLDASSEGSR